MPSHIPFVDGDQSASNRVTAAWLNGVNDFIFTSLPAGTGPSLIGWLRAATGAVTTTLAKWMGFQPTSVFEFMTLAQIADVQSGAMTLNLSATVQAAITACYGKKLRFEPGIYKLVTTPKILSRIEIDWCGGQAKFALATQNMNGLEIGDGTDPTRNLTFSTVLHYPAFIPFPGVTAFTSGACIYENYVGFITVIGPSFYGLDGATRKLFHGLQQLRASECETPYIVAQSLIGSGVYAEGATGLANRTVDCNYDFARIFNCTGDGIYWGANTAGLGAIRPTMYGLAAYGIRINATSGPSGQQYFIDTPDLQGDGTGGVYVQSGSRAIIRGGWVSGTLSGGVLTPAIWLGALADSCDISTDVNGGRVIIDGPANTLSSGNVDGDLTTAGIGVTISALAVNTKVADNVRIRQWPGTGLAITGTPAQVQVGALMFKSNGTDIASLSSFSALAAPVIAPCVTDKALSGYVAAATLTIPISIRFVQATGATNITTINSHGLGARLTLQAAGGAVNVASGGNLQLKTSPTAIPSGSTMSFICDGATWFEDGRNF